MTTPTYTQSTTYHNCTVISFKHEYLLDTEDAFKILNENRKFSFKDENDTYPSFLYNYKYVTYPEYLYINNNLSNYCFKNGNIYDLRKSNVIIKHELDEEVRSKYDVIEYLGGHYVKTENKTFRSLKNPMWLVNLDGKRRIVMADTKTFCILCEEGLQRIREFEKIHTNGKPITFTYNSKYYFSGHISKSMTLCMHQIIMNCYGNGYGTKNISVDHIDRNKCNNCVDNLRIATFTEQQQNSKGVIPGTKRARQNIARPLPDGIEQNMLRKYVVYYVERYNKEKGLSREYFRVEHPALDIAWQTTSSKEVSILDKLHSANKVAEDLENGIMPTKPDRELPKYFTMDKTATYLAFDRRRNGQRCTMRLPITEQSAVAEQLEKMKQLLIEKYDENVFI